MYIYMHGLKEDTLFEFIRTCSIRSTSPISCELITCHIWYFAGLAAWENDYRHHRCLKISRNCYETWSLQETMVTAQKFAWSQARCWQLRYFFLEISPQRFVVQMNPNLTSPHIFFRSVGSTQTINQLQVTPSTDSTRPGQAYKTQPKKRLKKRREWNLLWVKSWWLFFLWIPTWFYPW